MYKDRIKKWGLRKNLHGSDARLLAKLKAQMDKFGNQSEFTMSGTKLDYARVERHLQRKGLGHLLQPGAKLGGTRPFANDELPLALQVVVPHPTYKSPEHMDVMEDTLHALRCWIEGNLESGVWTPNSLGTISDNKAICSAYRFFSEGAKSLRSNHQPHKAFRWLNLGFHSLKDALAEQNSNMMVCLLRLTQGRLRNSPEISVMLWSYLRELSTIKYGSFHPISRISQHMVGGHLSAGDSYQLSVIAWFVAESMERYLGLSSIAVISSYSQWSNLERLTSNACSSAEERLRDLARRLDREGDSAGSVACRMTLRIDLAWILYDHKKLDDVRCILQEVIGCSSLSEYDLLRAYMLMGQTELALGNLQDAERCFRDRLRLNDAMWGELDSDSIRSLRDLVRVLTALSLCAEAQRMGDELDRRLDIIESKLNVELLVMPSLQVASPWGTNARGTAV